MSTLSVHDLQGIAAYQNKIRVPSGNGLKIEGTFELPIWTNSTRPSNPPVGSIGFNTDISVTELYNGEGWVNVGSGTADGSSEGAAAESPQSLFDLGVTTSGEYWIKPAGQSTAYLCYVDFNVGGLHWCAVSGMSSSGVRADASGNSSGLAALNQSGENTSNASLSGNSTGNSSAANFTLPRTWINACNPKGLRVKSGSQDMIARFDRSGSYVTQSDIWAYYYACNNYDNVPAANGSIATSTVNTWISANVNIYKDAGATGPEQAKLWSGNYHCGWSSNPSSNHMLHGSSNYSYSSSPYNGFCLDGTCWNESGIVYLYWD